MGYILAKLLITRFIIELTTVILVLYNVSLVVIMRLRMKIGVIKETKNNEYRAGLVPSSVKELVAAGHKIYIETALGKGIGITDSEYKKSGAIIVESTEELFHNAELLIKVKEPTEKECKLLTEKHTIFTYLHLAALPVQTKLLQESKATAIAYETVTSKLNTLPLLTPMSEVAGRLSVLSGSYFLLTHNNKGKGVLLNGVPGVPQGKVTIIGGGVVGTNALMTAVGMGAKVTVLDNNLVRLQQLDELFGNRITTMYSSTHNIELSIAKADLVIGAVLIPGAAAPKLVSKAMLSLMEKGTVIVDVAIDQGGCFATSKPTTYENPTFEVDGIIHYCVANMPGGTAKTSSFALNNATLPFILELANKGVNKAFAENLHLLNGLNVYKGQIAHPHLADSIGQKCLNTAALFTK